MFGYIRPCVAELKVKENEFYKALYCGLCKCMGQSTGQISRLTLSYDFVFLSLLRTACSGESFEIESGRCSLHPLKKRALIKTNQSMLYSANVGAILTYYKLLDDIADSRGLKKIISFCYLPAAKFMRRKALKSSLPENEIASGLNELSNCEKSGTASVDEPAEIFGRILAAVFSHGIKDDASALALEKIGFHIGKWIYIIDAANDYHSDIKTGEYNPFVNGRYDLRDISDALELELSNIDRIIEKINFSDAGVGNIIKNILYFGLKDIKVQVLSQKTTLTEKK